MIDVAIHIYFDAKKRARFQGRVFRQPTTRVGPITTCVVAVTTCLLFGLTLMLLFAYLFSYGELLLTLLYPLTDPPFIIWGTGLVIFSLGVTLHGWSRLVRRDMATSWEMSTEHRLVTNGPYMVIRHPSYLSYFMAFCGMFLMLPSLFTLFLLMGIPGYYSVAVTEELLLIQHFGDAYRNYMSRTGRFLPRLKRRA